MFNLGHAVDFALFCGRFDSRSSIWRFRCCVHIPWLVVWTWCQVFSTYSCHWSVAGAKPLLGATSDGLRLLAVSRGRRGC